MRAAISSIIAQLDRDVSLANYAPTHDADLKAQNRDGGTSYPISIAGLIRISLALRLLGTARLKCLSLKTLDKLAAKDTNFVPTLYGAISSDLKATRGLVVMLTQHGYTERAVIFLFNSTRRNAGKEPYLIRCTDEPIGYCRFPWHEDRNS